MHYDVITRVKGESVAWLKTQEDTQPLMKDGGNKKKKNTPF
jgi:hypothetical protein